MHTRKRPAYALIDGLAVALILATIVSTGFAGDGRPPAVDGPDRQAPDAQSRQAAVDVAYDLSTRPAQHTNLPRIDALSPSRRSAAASRPHMILPSSARDRRTLDSTSPHSSTTERLAGVQRRESALADAVSRFFAGEHDAAGRCPASAPSNHCACPLPADFVWTTATTYDIRLVRATKLSREALTDLTFGAITDADILHVSAGVLAKLDALGVEYEVLGGVTHCVLRRESGSGEDEGPSTGDDQCGPGGGSRSAGTIELYSGLVNMYITDNTGSGQCYRMRNQTAPGDAYVTNLEYRTRIEDEGDGNFYCGDYELWLCSGDCAWELCVYDNLGGTTDWGYDDDAEDDDDIYLNWRNTHHFDGESPNDWWGIICYDNLSSDDGQMNYIEFKVHWETPEAADLIIESSSRSPYSGVQPGDLINVVDTVRNQGTGTANASFRVQWYISLDSVVNESDSPWAYHDVACCLGPGQTDGIDGYAPWPDTPPYNSPNTTYWIRVKADRYDDVTESDENNNWGSQTWSITTGPPPEQYPDLIIQSSSRTPAIDVAPGDNVDLWHVVKNQGDDDTTWSFWTTWYISTDSNVTTSDYPWATAEIPCCLAPGETEEASGSVSWPNVSGYNTPGQTYYIAVMADDTGLVTEDNEGNNWGQVWTVTLDDQPSDEPDLVVESSSCTPQTGVQPAQSVNLSHVIRNQGDGAAESAFYATWFISTNSDVTTSDYEWAYSYVPCCLDPAETHSADGPVPWPNEPGYNIPGQTYYVAVMADDTGAVLESQEGNNWGQIWTVTLADALGDLTGTARDAATGDDIAYAEVLLAGEPVQYTNGLGQFTFTDVPAGESTLTVTKSGYYDVVEPVTITAGSTTDVSIWMTPESGGDDPVVVGVSGTYSGPGTHVYYLDGVWLDETFTATVEWKGHTPGNVQFITPYGTYNGSGGGSTWTQSLNMGTDFGSGGTLTVVAIADDLTESDPYVANFKVISPPPGILTLLIYPEPAGNHLKYVTPKLDLNPSGVDEGVEDVPDDMPLFGNEAFKFASMFDVSAQIDAQSGSATALSFDPDLPGGEGETKLAGYSFQPSVSGQFNWQFYENPDRWNPSGHIQIGAQVGADVPPMPIVFMFGPVPCYFRGHIDIGLAVGLDLVGWDAPGDAIFSGSVLLDPFPYAEAMLGAGVADVIAVEGYLGGGARMALVFPVTLPDSALENLELYLAGGVRVVLWVFTYEWPLLEYTWSPDLGLCIAERPRAVLQMLPRDYLRHPEGYAVFVANAQPRRGLRDVITVESPIELNVFGQSVPDLAAVGDDLLAAWIHDDPARTAVNRTEVVFIRGTHDESWWNWSTPSPVADDGTADFRPQIAPLPNGDVLLTWENVSEVLIEPNAPGDHCIDVCAEDPNFAECLTECKFDEMKSKTEIAVARYDSSGGAWGSQTILTSNDYVDRAPRLATAPDGTALLVWVSNVANEEIGSLANPNTIHFATYDGAAWTPPADIASGVPSIVKSAAAYNGASATLVFAGDTDGDPNTVHDRELFGASYDGVSWTALAQLTNDTLEDANPQLAYDNLGGLLLVWYRGGDIDMATTLSLADQETVVDLDIEASTGTADFRLAVGSAGQIAMVWQDASSDRVDMWRAIYDPALQLWSTAQQLTHDDWMEHAITPVYTASGDLVAMYDKVDTRIEVRLVHINGQDVAVNVPVPDRTDLYLLRHRVTGDLAVFSEDLSITPADAAVGDLVTISATIWNLGDVAAQNVDVGFYDGNPGEGGALIDMPTVPGLLYGGAEAVASVEWIVPQAPETHDIYVVADPYQMQEDGNRANNTAVFQGGLKPDLYIESLVAQESGPDARLFTVRVANASGWAVSDIDVQLRRNAVDGDLLTTLYITEAIAPGAHRDVSWTWDDLPSCVVTADVYAIADTAGSIDETNEDNNTRMVAVEIGEPFVPFDMNYDGFVSIIGDVPPFVECVYFGNCPDEPDPVCPGDCSGDGFLSIIGDVPCFIDCLYYGNCEPGRDAGGPPTGGVGFTIGGAVYEDASAPLMHGLPGVTVSVTQLDGQFRATTTTFGVSGLWSLSSVPAGEFVVRAYAAGRRFVWMERGAFAESGEGRITVGSDAPAAAIQSLQFLSRQPDIENGARPASQMTR